AHCLRAADSFSQLNVKVFTVAAQTDAQRACERHDHMRAVSACECDGDIRPPHHLLKKAHHIEMPDKAERSILSELNSCLHSRHLLRISPRRSRSTVPGSSA